MSSTINYDAIIIANLMGITLHIILIYNNMWRLRQKDKEDKIILNFIAFSLIACIIDPLVFYCDGKEGAIFRFVNVFGNLYLYFATMINSILWDWFLNLHLNRTISKTKCQIFNVVTIIGIVILIANFFVPLVFTVDSSNVYTRGYFYWIYLGIDSYFIVDSLICYRNFVKNGGALKFFPVGIYLIPILVGVSIQSFMYGVSTIYPFVAVAISGVISALQNQNIFRDTLTGVYNRFYLDYLKRDLSENESAEFTAIMLDVNGLKGINDQFGHAMGDDALSNAAKLMDQTAGSYGTVMRYAGDEFVILIKITSEDSLNSWLSSFRKAFDDFNKNSGKPYILSVAIGYSKMDLRSQNIDDLMNEIDEKMYKDKQEFYANNPEYDRRK